MYTASNEESPILCIFEKEDENWQQLVYEETGVVVVYTTERDGIYWVSNCGSCYGGLGDECHDIKTIHDYIAYIRDSYEYQTYLEDVSYGSFTKKELFWGIQNQIIHVKENQMKKDGTCYQDWELDVIHTEYWGGEVIALNMPILEYNTGEIWIRGGNSLADALEETVNEMNKIVFESGIEEISEYRVYHEKPLQIPNTFSEIKAQFKPGQVFEWYGEKERQFLLSRNKTKQ